MTIAIMQPSDYGEMYELWTRAAGMGLNSLDDSAEGIGRFLARNPRTCFVARRDGKLVGTILGGHDGRRGYLYHAAVSASERRKGIGRALVEAALAALRSEGINKVAFVVYRDNEVGNEFWEGLGFAERKDLVYRNKAIAESEMRSMRVG